MLILIYKNAGKYDTFHIYIIVIYFWKFTYSLARTGRIHEFVFMIGQKQAALTEKNYYFDAIARSPDWPFAGDVLSCYNVPVHLGQFCIIIRICRKVINITTKEDGILCLKSQWQLS